MSCCLQSGTVLTLTGATFVCAGERGLDLGSKSAGCWALPWRWMPLQVMLDPRQLCFARHRCSSSALLPTYPPAVCAVSYIFPVAFHWVAYTGRARYQAQKAAAEADLAVLAGSGVLATAGSLAGKSEASKVLAVDAADVEGGSKQHGRQHTAACAASGGGTSVPYTTPAAAVWLPSPFDATVQQAADQEPAADETENEGQLPGIPGGWREATKCP